MMWSFRAFPGFEYMESSGSYTSFWGFMITGIQSPGCPAPSGIRCRSKSWGTVCRCPYILSSRFPLSLAASYMSALFATICACCDSSSLIMGQYLGREVERENTMSYRPVLIRSAIYRSDSWGRWISQIPRILWSGSLDSQLQSSRDPHSTVTSHPAFLKERKKEDTACNILQGQAHVCP